MKNGRSLFVHIALLGGLIALPLGRNARTQEKPDRPADIVYEMGNGVTPPRPIYKPDPQYTDRARKKKINGTVVVAMIVTPEGNVRDLKVIESLDKDLDKQALAAMSTWKFEPATKDGQPVAVHLKAEADFRLY